MKLSDWKNCKENSVIYGIKNIITNKWYIGSCTSLRDRIHRHWYHLIHNSHHSIKLQRSFNNYGIDNFEIIVLRELKDTELNIRFDIENQIIENLDSIKNGYNIIPATPNFIKFSQSKEAKEKAGKTHWKSVIAINRFTNNIHKLYKSISEAAKDLKLETTNISQVCKNKLRFLSDYVFVYKEDYDNSKDYRALAAFNKGVPKSEETKRKMRLSAARSKQVFKYDLNNNLLCKYPSRSEAERQEGFKKEWLRTRMNKPINNYIFTYIQK